MFFFASYSFVALYSPSPTIFPFLIAMSQSSSSFVKTFTTLAFLITRYVAQLTEVDGKSMTHNLQDKDDLLLDKFTYNKSLQKIIESNRVSKDDKDLMRSMKVK